MCAVCISQRLLTLTRNYKLQPCDFVYKGLSGDMVYS